MVGTVLHSEGKAVASLAVPALRRRLVRFDRGRMDDVLIDLVHLHGGCRDREPLELLDGVGSASAVDVGVSAIDAPFEGSHRKPGCFQSKGAAPDSVRGADRASGPEMD